MYKNVSERPYATIQMYSNLGTLAFATLVFVIHLFRQLICRPKVKTLHVKMLSKMQDREWWEELDFIDILKYAFTRKDKDLVGDDDQADDEKNLLLENETK